MYTMYTPPIPPETLWMGRWVYRLTVRQSVTDDTVSLSLSVTDDVSEVRQGVWTDPD